MFSRASSVAVTTVAIAAVLVWVQVAAGGQVERRSHAEVSGLRHGIAWHRSMTWRFQDRAGVARTPTRYVERRTRSVPFLRWVDRLWSRRRIAARRLAARRSSVGRVAHLAFWRCVHGGEGDSHPSKAHPYSGPLQMTSYWAGYPVYDWEMIPVMQVYADAEAQFQKHERLGDLSTWLSGQWPRSSPPCLGYA